MILIKVIKERYSSNPEWFGAVLRVSQNDEFNFGGGSRVLRTSLDVPEREWMLYTKLWPNESLLDKEIEFILNDAREYVKLVREKLGITISNQKNKVYSI